MKFPFSSTRRASWSRVAAWAVSALVLLSLFHENVAAQYVTNRVLLKDVKTLTLRQGKQTMYRRTYAVPQLKCVGGNAKNSGFRPDVVQCTNVGSDGVDIQWECKAELPKDIRFGEVEVFCEGYDYPEDPYITKGSCGLEYTLKYTGYREDGSYWGSGSEQYFEPWRRADPRSRGSGGGGGGGGGGGPGFGGGPAGHGGSSPPPNYFKTTNTSSSSEGGYQPGFWSGVGLGGLASYLATSAANRNREREAMYYDTYGSNYYNAGPSTGFGYRQPTRSNSGGGSRSTYGSSSSSSSTHTSTGYGGTRRR
ncbi:Store-operated calcium entry-associated regulatory factor [Actinomortierella ambigua]|nr:Store-operated calcium entry-associated regulatory factor [Actinomortierella ambigua]